MGTGAERSGACLSLALLAYSATTAPAQREPAAAAKQLAGRVYDEAGKPVAGAAIGFFAERQFVDTAKLLANPMTITNADGAYTIGFDAAVDWGEVVVAAAGRQACAIGMTAGLAAETGSLPDVLLVPGARLAGRVRDEAGAPLAGVRICVENSIGDRGLVRLLAGARTDGKGIFTVPCVARTGLRLTATADGYLTESRLVAQQTPADLTLTKVGMVRGKVVDGSGAAVAGASVRAVTVESRDAEQPVRSAADGSFAITVPKQGRFRVGASEGVAPFRQFSSGLLHGSGDDVVVTEWLAGEGRTVEVVVVDAATKAAIPTFRLSQTYPAGDARVVMFHHSMNRRSHEGRAQVRAESGRPLTVVVDAPGHGFEIVPVPDDLQGPLTVELGPEAVLTGRVVDAETGEPVAGVAVRALPSGRASGSGGRVEQCGPLTDALGNYRVTGLRPGKYGVQAHAAERRASDVFSATVQAGVETTLALAVPARRWLEFELTGALPAIPRCRLSFGAHSESSTEGSFEHSMAMPPLPAITGPGVFKVGPVGAGSHGLQLYVPSRTRSGAGTVVPLGELDPDQGPTKFALPVVAVELVRGRVQLPDDVPSERIGVLANAEVGREHWLHFAQPNVAGVDANGDFVLDLPIGSYSLQLVDLVTGIIFHTEPEVLAIVAGARPLAIRPACHWLEIELVPEQAGDEVVLQALGVKLARPRGGACGAFLRSWSNRNGIESGSVPYRLGATRQRWLVPAGRIEINASQTFEVLRPWAQGYRGKIVAAEAVEIGEPVQRIRFSIPAPPSDEELLRRQD